MVTKSDNEIGNPYHDDEGKFTSANETGEKSSQEQEPALGIKLKANAPSLHIIKADISTEVSPIVGNQNQGEEMIKYLLEEFEQNPAEIWESNMFGKSLNDLVKEQLQSKLYTMPEEIRCKIQKTLQKIINEGSSNIITILL